MDDKTIISTIVGQKGRGKSEINRISLGMTHAEYFEFCKKQNEAKEKVELAEIALNEARKNLSEATEEFMNSMIVPVEHPGEPHD